MWLPAEHRENNNNKNNNNTTAPEIAATCHADLDGREGDLAVIGLWYLNGTTCDHVDLGRRQQQLELLTRRSAGRFARQTAVGRRFDQRRHHRESSSSDANALASTRLQRRREKRRWPPLRRGPLAHRREATENGAP